MATFTVDPTPLEGLVRVQRHRVEDERGFFSRLFCAKELASAGFNVPVAQINQTLTRRRGTVRGLHFQFPPHAEIKLVSCLRGEVFDVAIDLRRSSPTFLRWHGEVLSSENRRSLLIPQGFAHGFQSLSDDCELLYLHSHPFVAGAEGAVNLLDPAIGIEWPMPFTTVSARDRKHPPIDPRSFGL